MSDWKAAYEAWPDKTTLPITDKRRAYEVAGFKAGYLAKAEALEEAEKLLESTGWREINGAKVPNAGPAAYRARAFLARQQERR